VLASGAGFALPLASALNPCYVSASGGSERGAVNSSALSLPAALVAAQAPPSLALAPGGLAALAGAGGPLAAAVASGRGVDVQIVQWGVSP
jgi:hypothetical protein